MSEMIEKFYRKTGILSVLLSQKLSRFERNPDIAQEFEYWLECKRFKSGGVVEHGYTAEKLASLSEYLNGEGAFVMLMELRENPEKALQRIQRGFKRK